MIHSEHIKNALGISGVVSEVYSWRSTHSKPGAQIDMLIDRDDDVISLCEMKYTFTPWEMQSSDVDDFMRKEEVFRRETGTSKTIHKVLVSANGVKRNENSDELQNIVTLEDFVQRDINS